MSAPTVGAMRLSGPEKGEIWLEMDSFALPSHIMQLTRDMSLNSAACSA